MPPGRAAEDGWVLVVDGDRRPVGWLSAADLSGAATVDGTGLRALERTFSPAGDSVRVALDSAVLSPAGRAVAVDADGRLLGTARQVDVATAIREAGGQAGADAPPGDTTDATADTAAPVAERTPDGLGVGVSHGPLYWELLQQHLPMVAMPILFGLIIALPLGIACVRWPRAYPPVLAATSVLYALPSIALFAC